MTEEEADKILADHAMVGSFETSAEAEAHDWAVRANYRSAVAQLRDRFGQRSSEAISRARQARLRAGVDDWNLGPIPIPGHPACKGCPEADPGIDPARDEELRVTRRFHRSW